MTRRKSVCSKWTLVLVIIVCPFIYSRPQESFTTELSSEEKTTETPLRYSFRINSSNNYYDISSHNGNDNVSYLPPPIKPASINQSEHINITKPNFRTNRLIHRNFKVKHNANTNKLKNNNKISSGQNKSKPIIKKIITKWTDNVKEDNLEFSREEVGDTKANYPNSLNNNYFTSTEDNHDASEDVKQSSNKRYTYTYHPQSDYSEETHVYSSNVHIIDNHPFNSPTRPTFIFNTPTPTPIITNVGYPKPWQETQKPHRRPVKPIKSTTHKNPYNNHYPQYPGSIFDVTTFAPTTGYTDRIVIRPEEYAGVSDDCPTIFLTLNNTFQGQGKEACPDLNIAVNTNVVNKNNVIESDEEPDADTLTDIFGLPDDNSESDETANDYTESDEAEEGDSAPIESFELSNYNAANSLEAESQSANLAVGSPNSPISALSRPSQNDDDDGFGFSGLTDFFRPAISAFSWLASISPLSFPILSFLLAPIIFIVASTSGIATLFAPWALSYAREAPNVDLYRPQWQWDEYYKTWNLNSHYNQKNNKWRPDLPFLTRRIGSIPVIYEEQSWLDKVKQWMTSLTQKIKSNNRKNRRKK